MEELYTERSCRRSSSCSDVGIKCLRFIFVCGAVLVLLCAAGCNLPAKSSAAQVREFEKAGPITPEVDIDVLLKSRIHSGPYQVVPGDILQLQIPVILRTVSSDLPESLQESKPYLCRVSDEGRIALPIIGEVDVAHKTLWEIEASVISAYFPKYVVNPPAVVCTVMDYRIRNVTIVGAVTKPGMYPLRNDEMSLVSVLMKAGGIVEDGASLIIIKRAGHWWGDEVASVSTVSTLRRPPYGVPRTVEHLPYAPQDEQVELVFQPDGFGAVREHAVFASNLSERGEASSDSDIDQKLRQLAEGLKRDSGVVSDNSNDAEQVTSAVGPTMSSGSRRKNREPIVLPIKGLNVPFSDIALKDGDVVEVERLDPQIFTVMGLVKRPGAFDYPPDIKYNLVQALAFAGGIDLMADPHYVTVYRQDAQGKIVSATFGVNGKALADAASVIIKPGDVINAEVTPRTRTNLLLAKMLRLSVGVYVRPLDDD